MRRRSSIAWAAPSRLIDITPIVDGYLDTSIAGEEVTNLRRGNLAARARMIVLYDQSVPWQGLVIGTGNKTEALLGYTTQYGDNANAFNPIGDLYKSQVRQLSAGDGCARLDPGQATERRSVGRPDRRTGAGPGLRRSSTGCCTGWSIGVSQMNSWSPRASTEAHRAHPAPDRALRVQAPGAAGGQADDADAGRRLPLSTTQAAAREP